MWKVLEDREYDISHKLIMAIKSQYEETVNTVRGDGVRQSWFHTRTGVRQGSVLSPLLFVLYMDKCLKRMDMRGEGEHTLVYADDAAIITSDADSKRH